jgi:hypothetical protein
MQCHQRINASLLQALELGLLGLLIVCLVASHAMKVSFVCVVSATMKLHLGLHRGC